jgi:hypothetical protein
MSDNKTDTLLDMVLVLLAWTVFHLQQHLTSSRAKPRSAPARYDAGFSSLCAGPSLWLCWCL